jgi:hypothetical protein
MPRRIALAASLALTVIVGFAVLALGWYGGLVGGGPAPDEALAEDTLAVAEPTVPEPPPPPPPAAEPVVITEYVYVDGEPMTITVPAPARAAVPVTAPPPTGGPVEPVEEPGDPSTAEAPPPPPTAQPQPTAAPEPTPPPVPTDPPAREGPQEIEFEGTVTAIEGDVVTFEDDGSMVDVRVTEDLDRLSVGTEAKVHAIRVSGGYVSKEIEVGGD